jgi:hypothetical protein
MTQPSNTFDETKNWLWINQQENVPLEADKLNIDSQIASLLTRRAICELIGNGSANDGFLVDDTEELNPVIGIGNIYACGIKLEQPDEITYNTQPSFTETTEKTAGDGIYYLDIVEEQLTEIIDPDIIDPAIGFPTVLPKRAKWILKWVEDTAIMPNPSATHYHILVGIRSGGILVDQRNAGIVVAGADTGFQGREGEGLAEGTSSQGCDHILTVSKSGDTPYSTIQNALDYAEAQTPTKETPWIVAVCPGEYDEPIIVGKDYVSLVGVGGTRKDGARVLGHYVAPTIESCVENMMFEKVLVPGGTDGIIFAGEGIHDFINCKFKIASTNMGSYLVDIGSTGEGTYTFQDCDFEYIATGIVGGLKTHGVLYCGNSSDTIILRMTGCKIDFSLEDDNDYYFIFAFDGLGPKEYVIDNNVITVNTGGADGPYERIVLWTTSPGIPATIGDKYPSFINNRISVTHDMGPSLTYAKTWHYWVGSTGVLLVQNNSWGNSIGRGIYCDGIAYVYGDTGLAIGVEGSGTVYGSFICNQAGGYNHISQLDVLGKGCLGSNQEIPLNLVQTVVQFDTEVLDTVSDWFDQGTYSWTVRRGGYISIQGKLQVSYVVSTAKTLNLLVEILKDGISIDNSVFQIQNLGSIALENQFVCPLLYTGLLEVGAVITIAVTAQIPAVSPTDELLILGDGSGLDTVLTVQKIA